MCVRALALLLLTIFCAGLFAAQSSPEEHGYKPPDPPWVLLIDPVCPVTEWPPAPNANKEIRVMYFPTAKEAKLRNPESPSLQIAFNGAHYENNFAVVPFVRKDSYWQAVVPVEKPRAFYAIFYVKDENTSTVDDHAGKYWDVVFCDPTGQKSVGGLLGQAESYKGERWPLNIRREKDVGQAVNLLETAVATASRGNPGVTYPNLRTMLWEYKVERDGGDAQAYGNVAKEIERYLTDHPDDRVGLMATADFVVNHPDELPADVLERTISTVEAKQPDATFRYRAQAAFRRAMREPDLDKRLAAFDDIIAYYPGTIQAANAQRFRFYAFAQLKDVPGAEAAFAEYRDSFSRNQWLRTPDTYTDYLRMARLYVDKGVKLEAVLKLTKEAVEAVKANSRNWNLPPEFQDQAEALCAELRARAYLRLHKPALAVLSAGQAVSVLKNSAEAHFVLAQAYATNGAKQQALDEYFEAALMPSNKDLEYRAELERFYRKNFGNAKHYEVALNKRIADRFQAARYVPALLDQPAPAVEFTTLRGEKLDAATLTGKVVVINFWSPG